ncbi:MAG: isoprenylcysteine carboxylmethyltransferase family protein [Planctomycetota bacterium]
MLKTRRVRTKTRRFLYIFLFFFARPDITTLLIGLSMVALGQLIHIITYGVLQKRDTLSTTGPYAWCRNPFYVGSLLSDFGFCVISNPSDIAVAIITACYALVQGTFYTLQIKKEEKLLYSIHKEKYEDYCKRVRRRLIPSLVSAIRNGGFSFKWSAGLALWNRVFSRAVSAGFWICIFWGVLLVTISGKTRIINMDVNFNAVLDNYYVIIVAVVASVCYHILRFVEGRLRKKRSEEELSDKEPVLQQSEE